MDWKLQNPIIGHIGMEKYLVTIEWRNGELIADEPPPVGGKDMGPDPYTLLLSSLAACTLSTLRMYIDRKGWDIPAITVSLNFAQETTETLTTTIAREIKFGSAVTDEQKEKLLLIATKCPISKLLSNTINIHTL